jgi:hypothetical protein
MTQDVTGLEAKKQSERATTAVAELQRRRARELTIPELYRRPMGDRELHGCLKARA